MATGDTNLTNLVLSGTLTIADVAVSTALLLASGQAVDLNGETGGIILDADANSKLYPSADNEMTLNLNGAADFKWAANLFTALAGSTIATNTIAETTAGSGVTIDGLLVKDGIVGAIQAITGDGAITIQNSTVVLSKGSAAAITLAAPTATTHDGYIIRVVAISAQAHQITGSVDGFNAKGSSGTITFGGAIGDSVTLVAYNGHWYTLAKVNATVA